MNYKISTKRKDTGKWWTFGNQKTTEKGISQGFRKTPEFMQLVNETPDMGYINFVLFPDEPKVQAEDVNQDSGIPF